MNTTINTTRLERSNQLARERVARRGHKLLKDKSTEMMRQLLLIEKEAKALRQIVEQGIAEVVRHFMVARAFMTNTEINNAIKSSTVNFTLKQTQQNIMGLVVPHLEIHTEKEITKPNYITTHESFDRAVYLVQNLAPKIVELGTKEKAVQMLNAEIQTLRRRINALEHAVIPQIQDNIRYITFKLAENERGNLVRLMKVKQMLEDAEEL